VEEIVHVSRNALASGLQGDNRVASAIITKRYIHGQVTLGTSLVLGRWLDGTRVGLAARG